MMASVVIPAYNAARHIALCLGALTKQTIPVESFEVIVVDDGSTDQTAEITKQFPVRYIYQENQGPASARNRGAAASKGNILLFTDSDCIPTQNWIEEMLAPFQQEKIMAVKGAYRTEQREIVARFAQIEFEERFTLLEKAGKTDMVDTYSAGFRMHIFRELNGFDTRFPVANNEDTELSYRMAALQLAMIFTPKAIVYHLGHPDSIKRYALLKFSRGFWRMAVYRQFPKKMMQDTYTPKSLKLQILSLFFLLVTLPTPFFFPQMGVALILLSSCFFISTIIPFVTVSIKKDLIVGLCSPFLLALRAASLGSGALWGSWHARLN